MGLTRPLRRGHEPDAPRALVSLYFAFGVFSRVGNVASSIVRCVSCPSHGGLSPCVTVDSSSPFRARNPMSELVFPHHTHALRNPKSAAQDKRYACQHEFHSILPSPIVCKYIFPSHNVHTQLTGCRDFSGRGRRRKELQQQQQRQQQRQQQQHQQQ